MTGRTKGVGDYPPDFRAAAVAEARRSTFHDAAAALGVARRSIFLWARELQGRPRYD